jgi:hypothetical protein
MKNDILAFFNLLERANALENKIEELEAKIDCLDKVLVNKLSKNEWLPLIEAAPKLGLSQNALRHRIKRDHYPEGIAWKQKSPRSTIFVNMSAVGDYL